MKPLRYLSVCSGIEAASVAWHPLGWEAAAFSDIEKFPLAVLAHRWPDVPRHGDFTTIEGNEYGPIDLLVGGTPCQSFSIAGLRKGMDDERGNLALQYIRLADRARATWVVWENVPGVFSSSGGEDFRSFLSGLVRWDVPVPAGGWKNAGIIQPAPERGAYGVAWRVLDAQYFGVPRRRRRVLVVGYLGDWRPAAAVLLERESLRGDPAPRREARQVAPTIPSRGTGGGGLGMDFDCDGGVIPADCEMIIAPSTANPLTARMHKGVNTTMDEGQTMIAHTLRANHDASEGGTGRGTPIVPVATQERAVSENPDAGPDGKGWRDDGQAYTLEARSTVQAVAFAENQQGEVRLGDVTNALAGQGGKPGQGYAAALAGSAVRRLTPRECERLQGFPDDYTQIAWRGKPAEECPDGPRYKALGNSMAVPVMRWIGQRIGMVRAVLAQQAETARSAASAPARPQRSGDSPAADAAQACEAKQP